MGRKSIKDIRRKEIVKAFYRVSKKEGLENASVAKIAKELNINPSLIIHYFGTKDDLIYGLIEYILERYKLVYKQDNKSKGSIEWLTSIIDNLFSKKWNTYFDDGVFFSCYALIFRNKNIKSKFRELHNSLRSMLELSIREVKENGLLSLESPKEAADSIFILIEGGYYYTCLLEERNEEKIEKYKLQAYNLLSLDYTIAE